MTLPHANAVIVRPPDPDVKVTLIATGTPRLQMHAKRGRIPEEQWALLREALQAHTSACRGADCHPPVTAVPPLPQTCDSAVRYGKSRLRTAFGRTRGAVGWGARQGRCVQAPRVPP